MATNLSNRQFPAAAVAAVGIANIGAGNEVTFAILPGELVLEIDAVMGTAFNGTTNTLSVSDGTVDFLDGVDAKAAAGVKYSATVGKLYPEGGTLTVSLAQTGEATAGEAVVVAKIVAPGRQHENAG